MATAHFPTQSTQPANSKPLPTLSNGVPPPAYTPRRPLGPSAFTNPQIFSIPSSSFSPRGVPSTHHSLADMLRDRVEPEDDVEPGLSPISLRINTSINVTKNNNLVCITDTPTSSANAIAQAVVGALQEKSCGNCGIPMIDEEGRPRPLNIEVDASMAIDGSDNIVGHEGFIKQVLRQGDALRRRREADEDDTEPPAKRRRRAS